jgi:hypothetical protein
MRITAVDVPVVSNNMTVAELVRAAEHAFPYPSPIIKLMIEKLDAQGYVQFPDQGSGQDDPHGVNCPSCGAALQITLES